jgi:hypothetical protein
LHLQSAFRNAAHRGDLCLADALLNHRGDAGELFVGQYLHHLPPLLQTKSPFTCVIRQPMAVLRF